MSFLFEGIVACFALLGVVAPIAEDPPLDELEQQAFQAAADFAQDCVVQVETFGGLEIVNQQLIAAGPSSGTILTEDGWIITSTFQFRGQPASITVILPDEQRRAAKLVARDHNRELALLKIDTDKPLKAAIPSAKSGWQIGQWAVALGKTFDVRIASRSVGILSAQGRIFNKAIQTDAKISPQNYGGPLIDLNGKVMGILAPINPGIATEGEVEQWYDSGVGFAIPLLDILERLPKLQKGEDIYHGRAGFRTSSPDEFAPEIVLNGVTPGSPASKAGLKAGDRIIAAGATRESIKPVRMHSELKHVLGTIDAEQSVQLEVERDGAKRLFELTMVKELPVYREPYLGIVVDETQADGVPRVLGVLPDTPASRAGITLGDKILSVADQSIDEKNTLGSRLAFLDYREPVQLQIQSGTKDAQSISVKLEARPALDLEWKPVAYEKPTQQSDANVPKGTISLPLGDVKNKAIAIVPSNYHETIPHGLMIVFADAGTQDPKYWTDLWELFAREHRWIIVIAQSADEKAWSFEEVELASRLRSQISTTYKIDRRRICVGGIASGVLPAYISSVQNADVVRGVWLANGKLPSRIRVLAAEPLRALNFFVNGPDASNKGFVELVNKAGHAIQYQNEEWKASNAVDSQVLGQLQRWMRMLETH